MTTDAVRVALMGLAVVEDFLPSVGHCALQDYARLNNFLVHARALRAEQPPRSFMYFENCEGGMEAYRLEPGEFPVALRGWMSPDCLDEDYRLVEWMTSASVGEHLDHRLGTIVCVL